MRSTWYTSITLKKLANVQQYCKICTHVPGTYTRAGVFLLQTQFDTTRANHTSMTILGRGWVGSVAVVVLVFACCVVGYVSL